MQRPHPAQTAWSMRILRSGPGVSAPCAHTRRHVPQPTHRSATSTGLPSLCISSLPAREPHPMPTFFTAPPTPIISWPLKWVREITASASITARPIFASFTYSHGVPSSETTASSVPLRPSATMTWHPAAAVEKPFSSAVSRWSRAFLRPPT